MYTRYTITSEGASPGYFKLVEDPAGAWVTWAEVEAIAKLADHPPDYGRLVQQALDIEQILRDASIASVGSCSLPEGVRHLVDALQRESAAKQDEVVAHRLLIAEWRQRAASVPEADCGYRGPCDYHVTLLRCADELEKAVPGQRWLGDTGYVIERHLYSVLHYWTGRAIGKQGAWSPKHQDAVRFARAEDAAILLSWLLAGEGNVVQHAWAEQIPPVVQAIHDAEIRNS